MGRGGDSSTLERKVPTTRAPSEKPPFTVGDLKRAIPPHCFKRSTLWSAAYLAVDLSILAALYSATNFFSHPSLPSWAAYVLWPLYWAVSGSVATGVWVIAHECGHQAFSEQGWINDTVGMIFHTALLVPYFSWKYSHRRHHSNTGSLERDEVFVPRKKENLKFYSEYLQHPMGRLFVIAITLTAGWPLYLMINSTGRKYERRANHFSPNSPIFSDREKAFVLLSDAGLIAMAGLLCWLGSSFGFLWLAKVYLVPLTVVNSFLVLITFLQHTHPEVPHYEGSEWDWLKGALATIDRDYGILNHVFHHIGDTHVAHHLFSTMPHYHAQEATEALKPILGPYYRKDTTPIYQAVWREFGECVYVAPDEGAKEGIVWYRRKLK